MPVEETDITTLKRQRPHVGEITDWAAQQSVSLLWDRVFALQEALTAAQATITSLVSASNTNETAVSTAQKSADQALSLAQTPTTGNPSGPTPVSPPAGSPGSQTNPIIAMSSDPAKIAASVRLSLQSYGIGFDPTNDQYWIDKASTVAQFSNGKWYLGWNAYWHERANPTNTGSADPNLGDLPSPLETDQGQAAAGFAAAPATGHDGGGALSAFRAGQILGGTATEWAALGAAAGSQAIRDANQEQFLRRMIWHLNNAGFTAGRQMNPSMVLSADKLTVTVDGTLRAYDMFTGPPFTMALGVHVLEVFPANQVADAGIPD